MIEIDALKQLFSNGKNYSINEIRRLLKIKGEDETNSLISLINTLEESAFIFEENNKYSILSKRDDLVQGNIKINCFGDGYVEDIKIPKEYLGCVLTGDLVLVKKCLYNEGKVEGIIEKLIKQKDGFLTLNYENGELIPYKNHFKYKIKLNKNDLKNIENDSRIRVKIDPNPIKGIVKAELVNIIGHKDDVDLEEKTIAVENGFDIAFSKEVKDEVNCIELNITEEEISKRRDLRNRTIFTIDCKNTKDMDDAVSLDINDKGNYILGVHIADVSHYVKPCSKTFEEAKNRGTSAYINNTSIPMLDRRLSNDICSLNPNVDRLTKTVEIEISPEGNILDYDIYSSVINSKMKMNYDDVNSILEDNIDISNYKQYKNNLILMNKLSKILDRVKLNRGYLPFNETDVRTEYDKFGNPIEFGINKQRSSEKIIENFMLVANECVGNYFYNMNIPGIYRVHESPKEERITEIFDFIDDLGYKIKHIKNISNPKAIQSILKELLKTEEYPVLSDMILKGMQKAKYSSFNVGHFGLALDKYIQFTSPIRRFPDLEAHTILTKFENFNITVDEIKSLETTLEENAIHSSYKERQADKAEKEGLQMRMAEYMEQHIGEYFNGRITAINNLGVIVKTINQIEGKVALSNIKGDYYIVDDRKTKLIGKKTKEVYKIGNLVRVKVKSANKETRNIEYELKENLSKPKTLQKII